MIKQLFSLCTLLLLASCAKVEENSLTSITIVDRNGFTETINNEDRLAQYEHTNFSTNQPYQKVVRVYKRDEEGNLYSSLNSYHENGQPYQYLELVNGRARGPYLEWHANGILALQAEVIEGEPELTDEAKASWVFDGTASSWDDRGSLAATFPYEKGVLSGTVRYYHPNGVIWKEAFYQDGLQEGEEEIYTADGLLLQKGHYKEGFRDGSLKRFWQDGSPQSDEIYYHGTLMIGKYTDKRGKEISSIKGGNGTRALFSRTCLSELHQYKEGFPVGEVTIFDENGKALQRFHVKDGLKHGEDVEFYAGTARPKISLTWVEGQMKGSVKTWYPSGSPESEREIHHNKKNGLLTGWYEDGSLMLIEEYSDDNLQKGEYYKRGEKRSVSRVANGKGTATLYEPDGTFKTKITYKNGVPVP